MRRAFILLAGFFGSVAAVAVDIPLCATYASQLAVMVNVDQAMRGRWDWKVLSEVKNGPAPRFVLQTSLVDRVNTERFKQLVRVCGWPNAKEHGQAAVDDSWLIAQHADHDRKFQREFLAQVQKRVDSGQGSSVQLAYLSDRLDVADGKPQKYGTQLVQKSACEFDFSPLDHREKVEARRKELKWPPLEEYKKLVHQNALPAECSAK